MEVDGDGVRGLSIDVSGVESSTTGTETGATRFAAALRGGILAKVSRDYRGMGDFCREQKYLQLKSACEWGAHLADLHTTVSLSICSL